MRIFFLSLILIPAALLAQITHQEVVYVPAKGDTLTGEWMRVENPRFLVLIIPGSGPTDRNGNSRTGMAGPNNLKKLARGLAENGISSFRIDKRGAGTRGSDRPDSTTTFDLFVEDALGWMVTLESMEGKPFEAFIGHSQGGLVALLAAERADIPKVVTLAGAGEPITDILKYQMGKQMKGEVLEKVESKLDSIKLGYRVANNVFLLRGLFHPDAQRFIASWAKYDPCKAIRQYQGKVLIVQGGRDLQVNEKQGKRLQECDKGARYAFFPEMNHVLVNSSESLTENLNTYKDPELPLTDGLIQEIVEFLNGM